MKYIYTLNSENFLESLDIYAGEKLKSNQTLVPYNNDLITPFFNFDTQNWEEFGNAETTQTKPKTEEELLQEQIEETKHKTVTEYELRKLLAEQQKNNMQMMMMMLKK